VAPQTLVGTRTDDDVASAGALIAPSAGVIAPPPQQLPPPTKLAKAAKQRKQQPWNKVEDCALIRLVQAEQLKVGLGGTVSRWAVIARILFGQQQSGSQAAAAAAQAGAADGAAMSRDDTQKPVERLGKQCRERYLNHLDPRLNHGPFDDAEDQRLIDIHATIGPKWAKISRLMAGRSQNTVKNRWHTLNKSHKSRSARGMSAGETLDVTASAPSKRPRIDPALLEPPPKPKSKPLCTVKPANLLPTSKPSASPPQPPLTTTALALGTPTPSTSKRKRKSKPKPKPKSKPKPKPKPKLKRKPKRKPRVKRVPPPPKPDAWGVPAHLKSIKLPTILITTAKVVSVPTEEGDGIVFG
jgi:hypothetical protein